MPDIQIFHDILIRTTALCELADEAAERAEFLWDMGYDGEAMIEEQDLLDLWWEIGRMID